MSWHLVRFKGVANQVRYCVKTLGGHVEWVREVVPSDDGRWLVSASSDQVGVHGSYVWADLADSSRLREYGMSRTARQRRN